MSNANIKVNPYFEIPTEQADINSADYEMSEFDDEIVEFPWTYELIEKGTSPNGNLIMELVPYFGEQIQQGTPINSQYLGNVDVGVKILYLWKLWVNEQVLSLALKGDATDGAILNGFLAIQFYTTFMPKDVAGRLIILDGYYDEVRGELSV